MYIYLYKYIYSICKNKTQYYHALPQSDVEPKIWAARLDPSFPTWSDALARPAGCELTQAPNGLHPGKFTWNPTLLEVWFRWISLFNYIVVIFRCTGSFLMAENKTLVTWNPGWFIGILIMAYCIIIPIYLGRISSPMQPKQPGFFSLLKWLTPWKINRWNPT